MKHYRPKPCVICGIEFEPANPTGKTCPDPECKKTLAREGRLQREATAPRECEICGEPFKPVTNQRTCSEACRQAQLKRALTTERLKVLLHYNPETGVFTWRQQQGSRAVAGSVAGSASKNGRIEIGVDGTNHLAHRLAWLYMTGEWPADEIDHEDLDPSNNRWGNLRSATHLENSYNKRVRTQSKTGIKGVHFFKRTGKWTARIKSDGGSSRHLGYFDTAEEAAASYAEAAAELHGVFGRITPNEISTELPAGLPRISTTYRPDRRRRLMKQINQLSLKLSKP